jgi:uncharacterized protein YidB (DUF937 family)
MGMLDGLLGGIVGAGMVSVVSGIIEQHSGPDLLQQLSQKSGLSVQDLAQKLSHVLPQAVDKLTPDGAIPKA